MIRKRPKQQRSWTTFWDGDMFGDISHTFGVDLFNRGLVNKGKKLYPHTLDGDISGIEMPSAFYKAKISDGVTRQVRVWAVSDNKKIMRSASNATFVNDGNTGILSDEATSDSDLLSVGDESDEVISTNQVVINDALGTTGAFSITGDGNNTKWAQSFKAGGPFTQLTVELRKVGSPTDNLTISFQADNTGEPSGTPLTSINVDASLLGTTFEEKELDVDDFSSTLQFDINETYWVVFERSGSSSTANYAQVKLIMGGLQNEETEDDPYEDGTLLNNNGSAWSRTILYKVTDTFTADGNWTVPTNVTEADVECWGAGGGGTTDTGGGGGGAYAKKNITGLTPTDVIAIQVGVSAANTDGEDSTFDSTVVVAKGGLSGTNGGTGGQASASTGDTKFDGGDGSAGAGDRGGGGGAGDEAGGKNAIDEIPGLGGSSNGGVGGGIQPTTITRNGGGIPSGGGNSSSGAQRAGARGEVRVTYTVAATSDYPVVTGRAWGRTAGNVTSHSVSTPEATLPGEMLILIFSCQGSSTNTAPSGWTKLEEDTDFFNKVTQTIFYKRSTGDDDGNVTTSASTGSSYIMYRIARAGTPQASQTKGSSTNADPPNLDMTTSEKRLWIAAGSWDVTAINDVSAAPSNYDSLIVEPENFFGDDNRDAKTAVADRLAETDAEDPGAFTSGSEQWVAGTIGVPYEADLPFLDVAMNLQIDFPKAEERLYLTTTKDVRFLNEEGGVWQSLWRAVLQGEDFNTSYPVIMKNLGAGGTLIIANDNKVHLTSATATGSGDLEQDKIVLSPLYYARWIVPTTSAVYIGFTHKESETLTSRIVRYQVSSERVDRYDIKEGATVGFYKNNNCHIIDKKGQVRAFNGSRFQEYNFLPPYYRKENITTLPHRNGILSQKDKTKILWEGQYPFPCGVWAVEDEGNVYHKDAFVFDKSTLNSLGSLEGEVKAMYEDDVMFYGSSIENGSGTSIKGIYSDIKTAVASTFRGRIETSRFLSSGNALRMDWQKVYYKGGSVNLKYRTSKRDDSEDSYSGTWTAETTFTCSTAGFITAVDNEEIQVGHEVIVRKGNGGGLLAHITAIDGGVGVEKTITIDEGLSAVTSGTFTFSVENWKKVGNKKALGGKNKEWVQIQAEITEEPLEEVQVATEVSETLNQ